MSVMSARSLVVFIFIPFFGLCAFSQERIGTFSFEELRLRATLLSQEDTGADFSLADSAFAMRWRKDKNISAYFEVASEKNRNLPVYYAAVAEDRLGFAEAYAEYQGVYGRVRFGLIPLDFGYDGMMRNYERLFNRSLVYTRGIIGISDFGLSFKTENNGYYSQIAAHNGEINTESDGRIWTSGNWGYSDRRRFRAQLSLQTGYVTGSVSEGAVHGVGGVNNGETALWKNGSFFLNWYPPNWNFVVQAGAGEVEQDSGNGRYNANMLELTRFFSKNFGAGFRYDQFDPDRNSDGDMQTEASLMFVFKSMDSTSDVILLATKSIEEANERPDDQLRLVWLLTPYSR